MEKKGQTQTWRATERCHTMISEGTNKIDVMFATQSLPADISIVSPCQMGDMVERVQENHARGDCNLYSGNLAPGTYGRPTYHAVRSP